MIRPSAAVASRSLAELAPSASLPAVAAQRYHSRRERDVRNACPRPPKGTAVSNPAKPAKSAAKTAKAASKSDLSIDSLLVRDGDNYFGLEPKLAAFERAGFVVIQAPFEKTVSYGHGAGAGPRAIRSASQQVEFYDDEIDDSPILKHGVATTEELDCDCDGEEINRRIYEVARQIVAANKIPALIGGEHTVSYGSVRACHEKYPKLSVLHFDAHSDMRDTYMGQKWNHATAAARINELCPITQIGIRSRERGDEKGSPARPVRCYPAFKYRHAGPWFDDVIGSLSENVYITVDVDGFDPSVMPGTGTPEPGGLDWWTVIDLIHRACRERTVVGFDVVEVAPLEGTQQTEYAAAKLLSKMINYTAHYGSQK
jgi:agmatinase